MKNLKRAFVLLLVVSANLQAQQAQWEFVYEGLYGKMTIAPNDPNIIYLSPGKSPIFGLHKSTDGGKSWVNYQQGYTGLGDIMGILIDPINPQRLWIYGGPFRGIVRSENGGLTAVPSDSGIYFSGHHGYMITSMAYAHQRDILYVGDYSTVSGGILRSFDGGRHWELAAGFEAGFIPAFLFVAQETGWLFSGSTGRNVWRSKDSGKTWEALGAGKLAETAIWLIARVPGSKTLYCAGRYGGVFKSYDLGDNWFSVSTALTDSGGFVGGLVVSSLDTNYVFIGSQSYGRIDLKGGVFLSTDGGVSWQIYDAGLPQYQASGTHVWSIAQAPDFKFIYLSATFTQSFGVFDIGIYRLNQGLLTNVEARPHLNISPTIRLEQNYPNPFNAQTQIEFSINKAAFVSLDIYSPDGQLVKKLFGEFKKSGRYRVSWNGKNSKGGEPASGIYLYRLKVGNEILTRKLLIIH